MDENGMLKNGEEITPENKKLTAGAKIIFFFAIPVLSLVYSLGILGTLGLPIMLAAAAMNVVLALELEKSAPKLILLLLVNLLPFAAIFIMSGSPAVAVNALFVIALALPIWLTVKMGCRRSVSIVAAALTASLLFSVSFALAVISEKGVFNMDTLAQVIDSAMLPLRNALAEMSYEENGKTVHLFTSSDVNMMVYYVKSMLVGSLLAAMMVWAYLATLATRVIASAFGTQWRLPGGIRVIIKGTMTDDGPKVDITHEPVLWRIDMDSVSVVIYIIAYLAVLFGGAAQSVFYSVVMNVFVILTPGFVYLALRDTILGIRGKGPKKSGFFSLIIGAVLIFINPSLIVFILAALGIASAIRENMARREGAKRGKEQNK